MRRKLLSVSSCLAVIVLAGIARGEDAFYEVSLNDLKLTEGKLPGRPAESDWDVRSRLELMRPYAVLDGEGEAILGEDAWIEFGQNLRVDGVADGDEKRPNSTAIAIRAPAGQEVRGRLFLPKPDASGMTLLRFTVPADKATKDARRNFYLTRARHYGNLAARNRPGSAWFRFQALESRRILDGKSKAEDVLAEPQQRQELPERVTNYEDTYQIFSGGRAVSENLQLDRLLRPTKPDAETVSLEKLKGITVAEMDWGPLTKEIEPALDPLAALLPADQHALFFPTFQALTRTIDEAAANGTPLLHLLQERAEDVGTREKYQRQLCLELDAFSRLLGDQIIGSVAVTGGDPYLRTGADVAILFETNTPRVLNDFLEEKYAAARKQNRGCEEANGSIAGVEYRGVRTPSRSICSYRAATGNAVIVTNSLAQLERLIRTSAEKETSLAQLPEYRFFRHRYPRTNSEETAFLVVTDATIRRWCGPKWRIATSRRTRAAAVMMQLQAARFEEIVAGKAEPKPLDSALFVPDMGEVALTRDGIASATYGSLEFMTPISELDFTTVTPGEAESYERWRGGYQQNWRQFFDPIAVSVTLNDKRLGGDVTVMPLIEGSDYREAMRIAGESRIAPDAGDRHAGTVFHWVMAVDPKSPGLQQVAGILNAVVRNATGGPLSWLGKSISVYGDNDPFWLDLAKVEEGKQGEFFEQNAHRIPVAFRAEVASPLKLAAFLTGLRAFIEQSAPNLTTWESKKHGEQSYVSIRPTKEGQREISLNDKFAIHYAPTPTSLLVTLNEDLLKRAIDREASGKESADGEDAEERPAGGAGKPWLGESMALQLDRGAVDLLAKVGAGEYQKAMQARAWRNIPILNEWKRRFPQHDPVALNEKHWQALLRCPGGGKYVWNETYQTMESTMYGHPGEPKEGPVAPVPLRGVTFANFGVTFEKDGLRARMALDRAAPTAE